MTEQSVSVSFSGNSYRSVILILIVKDISGGSNYRARLYLTELGREAAEHVAERAKLAVDLAGGFMTEDSRQSFYDALEKIASNLQSISEGGLPE
jgi:truncated hemoglobin YjbI